MPTSVSIGLLVLAAILLLVSIVGGNFKLFGAEVVGKVSNPGLQFFSGVLGFGLLRLRTRKYQQATALGLHLVHRCRRLQSASDGTCPGSAAW